MVELKSNSELARMQRAGNLVGQVLDRVGELIRPGVTTAELSRQADAIIRAAGAKAAFDQYPHPKPGGPAFPAALCTSVNDVVVHGIPSDDVVLTDGDIVSVDCGVKLDGYYGDAARTYAVGRVSSSARKLLEITHQALQLAIDGCTVGGRLRALGRTIQDVVERHGLSVVRDFTGHGIGRKLHEDPEVPNYCDKNPNRGLKFRAGMVIAIEPMVTLGAAETATLDDGWTVVTRDRSLAAHFEHTVAITNDGPRVLTT